MRNYKKLTFRKWMNRWLAFYFQKAPWPEGHLSMVFFLKTGRRLKLKNPKMYNDKIQWIKLYDRNPLLPRLNDKLLVRDYVAGKGYGNLLNELLGVYDRVEAIDLEALPGAFVLKANHGSSWNIICRDKEGMDWQRELGRMDLWIHSNYCHANYEWGYRDIKARILCEKYLGDERGDPPMDYKFFCFKGIPRVVAVDYDRFKNHKRNLYDMDWHFMDCRINFENDRGHHIDKPVNFETMKQVAADLSRDFHHVRVDLYEVEGKVIFSELTFYNGSGMSRLRPESFEEQMGEWLQIPEIERNDHEKR